MINVKFILPFSLPRFSVVTGRDLLRRSFMFTIMNIFFCFSSIHGFTGSGNFYDIQGFRYGIFNSSLMSEISHFIIMHYIPINRNLNSQSF